MKMYKIIAISIGLFLGISSYTANAQDVLDGVYEKQLTKEKEYIPYDHIREADVFWSKRVFREIDVNEKMNLPFKYPRQPLIAIIHTAAMEGELTVYDPDIIEEGLERKEGYDFIKPLAVDDVKSIGARTDTSTQIDPITLEEKTVFINQKLEWRDIVRFRIKEDWFFDENTSTFQVRILGLSPVREAKGSDGTFLGYSPMYWIYYPDLRPILTKYEIYNPKNDAIRLSWEDLFEARLFTSFITKESNVFDRKIGEYAANGIDALLESDRIKQEMFEFEHDLWTY
jgi:gliding motility associated protien GldN